ncbi:MAG: hypothetical protein DMD82_10300 [Candidatus Rokuibacteriota bacterium]|nr:MAG: hypothetical protein DMD82_10300 [Candidatus Rokubacteria bacterium]
MPGGLTLDRTLEIIPLLERTGRLDYFLISMGGFGNIEFIHPTTHYGLSPFVHCAAAVKKVSKLPVIAVGKIKFALEEVLREGKADLVAMARPLICDPDLPVKIMEERQEEIRSCLSCNECHGRVWFNHRIGCAFNPEAGNEIDGEVTRAAARKRVVVVGGGPAGCEAARVAALRGHEVILLERSSSLGGRINIAAALPDRDDYFAVPLFFTVQLDTLGVDVRLKTEATAETVLALEPDAVVVATGTRPWLPDIPGAASASVWQMEQVITQTPELGRRAVVLDYDHHVAPMATADLLATRGSGGGDQHAERVLPAHGRARCPDPDEHGGRRHQGAPGAPGEPLLRRARRADRRGRGGGLLPGRRRGRAGRGAALAREGAGRRGRRLCPAPAAGRHLRRLQGRAGALTGSVPA